MISMYAFLTAVVLLSIAKQYLNNNAFPWILIGISNLNSTIQLPLILALTIKHAKRQKSKPKIPNKPVFYDSEPEEISVDVNGTRDNVKKIKMKKRIRSHSLNNLLYISKQKETQIKNGVTRLSKCN